MMSVVLRITVLESLLIHLVMLPVAASTALCALSNAACAELLFPIGSARGKKKKRRVVAGRWVTELRSTRLRRLRVKK